MCMYTPCKHKKAMEILVTEAFGSSMCLELLRDKAEYQDTYARHIESYKKYCNDHAIVIIKGFSQTEIQRVWGYKFPDAATQEIRKSSLLSVTSHFAQSKLGSWRVRIRHGNNQALAVLDKLIMNHNLYDPVRQYKFLPSRTHHSFETTTSSYIQQMMSNVTVTTKKKTPSPRIQLVPTQTTKSWAEVTANNKIPKSKSPTTHAPTQFPSTGGRGSIDSNGGQGGRGRGPASTMSALSWIKNKVVPDQAKLAASQQKSVMTEEATMEIPIPKKSPPMQTENFSGKIDVGSKEVKKLLTLMENQQATIKDLTTRLDSVEEQFSEVADNTSKSFQTIRNENKSRFSQVETAILGQANHMKMQREDTK